MPGCAARCLTALNGHAGGVSQERQDTSMPSQHDAANDDVLAGFIALARPFAQRALAHPEMKSLAEQLLARLGPS